MVLWDEDIDLEVCFVWRVAKPSPPTVVLHFCLEGVYIFVSKWRYYGVMGAELT